MQLHRKGGFPAGDGMAVRAAIGPADDAVQALFHRRREDVLPAARLVVHVVPGEAQDIEQEALGQAMAPHNFRRPPLPFGREAQLAFLSLQELLLHQPLDHQRDGGVGEGEALGQRSDGYRRSLLLEAEGDGQVLLDGSCSHVCLALVGRPTHPM